MTPATTAAAIGKTSCPSAAGPAANSIREIAANSRANARRNSRPPAVLKLPLNSGCLKIRSAKNGADSVSVAETANATPIPIDTACVAILARLGNLPAANRTTAASIPAVDAVAAVLVKVRAVE